MSGFGFTTGGRTVLPVERASIFFDGQYSEPRLHHPEGVAVAPDGDVWAGSGDGDVVRIAADGSRMTKVAATGGFVLGLAFDGAGHLFACELKGTAVLRLDLATGKLDRFTPPGIRVPNYPVVDGERNCLYVSDSFAFDKPGPGVWRYDLSTGAGGLWWGEPMTFANGMALANDGKALFVAETFARKVSRIAIGADGMPAGRSDYAIDLPGLPDGLALDDAGNLYVSCYEPSRIVRVDTRGRVEVYAEDPTAHAFCHPTNIAFDRATLYTTNLGRWHITKVATDTTGMPVVARVIAARAAGRGR